MQPDRCFPRHDHVYPPTRFWNLWDLGGLGRVEQTAICELHIKNFAKRAVILMPHIPLRITQSYGLNRHPLPRCTSSFQQYDLLPLVWEGRTTWEDHSKPPTDDSLQTRIGLWDMLPLSLGHLRGHLASWLKKLPAAQRRRGRVWWHIFLCLAISRHCHQRITTDSFCYLHWFWQQFLTITQPFVITCIPTKATQMEKWRSLPDAC